MNGPWLVAVVTDGERYWTEIFHGEHPHATLSRYVSPEKLPSAEEAKALSPWWPPDRDGDPPSREDEDMHRATCGWVTCRHELIRVASLSPSFSP